MKGMASYCSFFGQKCKVVTQVWMILTHMKHLHMDCERIERKPRFCISDLVWKRIGFWRIWNVLQADQLPPLFKLGCSQLLNKIQNANSTFSIYLYGTKAKGKKAFVNYEADFCRNRGEGYPKIRQIIFEGQLHNWQIDILKVTKAFFPFALVP